VAVLAAVLAAAPSCAPRGDPPADSSVASARGKTAWAPGNTYRYRLQWSTQGVQGWLRAAGGEAAAFATELDADLVLEASPTGAGTPPRLVARFENVRRLELAAFGGPLVSDKEATARELTRESAILELGAGGEVTAVAFTGSDSSLFAHLLRGVWRSVGWSPAPAGASASWTVSEPGPSGHAVAHYERDATGAHLRRERERYESLSAVPVRLVESEPGADTHAKLDSSTRWTFAEGRVLQRVEDREVLTVAAPAPSPMEARTRLDLQLLEQRGATAVMPATGAARPVDEVAASMALNRRLLEQRVAGLTLEQVERDLTIHQGVGQLPEQRRWVWRTTGLLLLDPPLATRLLDRALNARTSPRTRALIFDLWASAGTAEAQAAMRAALSASERKLPEAEYGLLVTRLGFLQNPEAETVKFVRALVEDTQQPSYPRRAAVGVLGSLVHALADAQPAEARAQHEHLLAGLRAAPSPEDRIAYLIGLGNAGVDGDVAALAPYAADPSPVVRGQVAWSLRSLPSAESRDVLLRLLSTSTESEVQIAALHHLARYPLQDVELAVLERLARPGGALAPAAAWELLDVLAGRTGPRVQAILDLLSRRPDLSVDVRNRAQRELQAVSSPPVQRKSSG
jgi:hypothetical protein